MFNTLSKTHLGAEGEPASFSSDRIRRTSTHFSGGCSQPSFFLESFESVKGFESFESFESFEPFESFESFESFVPFESFKSLKSVESFSVFVSSFDSFNAFKELDPFSSCFSLVCSSNTQKISRFTHSSSSSDSSSFIQYASVLRPAFTFENTSRSFPYTDTTLDSRISCSNRDRNTSSRSSSFVFCE